MCNWKKIQENDCCIGCGICEDVFEENTVELDNNGKFCLKVSQNIDDLKFSKLCPITNNEYISSDMWGRIEKSYYGFSINKEIRYRGSSGGILSAIAIYLLNKNIVDGIIQVRVSKTNPIENEVVISTSEDDVMNCCGSRYAPVKMFSEISKLIEIGKKYAVIGKPCDIRAIQNYLVLYPEKEQQIIYKLSFFCAGTPTLSATNEVIEKMNKDINDLTKFDYRGNGWPGFTKAEFKDGSQVIMEYNESWGKILGRTLHNACRFCADGVGMTADISCGDAWYCDEKGYPLFVESDGRNVILIRNKYGLELIDKMVSEGYIKVEEEKKIDECLMKMQPYQYKRKAMMFTKIRILRLFKKYTPQYGKAIKEWDKKVPFKEKADYAKGTVLRVLKKRIK